MKKETFEWVQSWCDHADEADKPRVLLVGDSITRGYESIVRERLKDVAYVDYLSTSYAVDNKLFSTMVEAFCKNSDYALVHFNHGLHGFHMSPRTYKSKIKNLLLRTLRMGGYTFAKRWAILSKWSLRQWQAGEMLQLRLI